MPEVVPIACRDTPVDWNVMADCAPGKPLLIGVGVGLGVGVGEGLGVGAGAGVETIPEPPPQAAKGKSMAKLKTSLFVLIPTPVYRFLLQAPHGATS